MKLFVPQYKLLALLVFLLVLAGCKQPETTVVDDEPTAAAPQGTTAEESVDEADFQQLVIGEYNSIPSLDPLFADNAATMRAIQLVYEGLVRLDADGSVVSGMAESWEVSEDSLTYTFQIRDNIYYHDSDAFSTGTGRKMTSGDVKFVFERMAQAGIPSKAAHLFMEIDGFDPYFHEQHEIFLPSQRKLDTVSGIQTPDDSTVIFELVNQDSDFLKKLATPLAVIYPEEAIEESPESFSAVGTGPFQFSQTSDTATVFSKFQNYYAASEIRLNRVDVVNGISESNLFRGMSTGDIHVAPQLSPQMMENLLNNNGDLRGSYAERYNLTKTSGFNEFVLRYNPAADLPQQDVQALADFAGSQTESFFDKLSNTLVRFPSVDTTENFSNFSLQTDQLYSAYFDDPFVRTYLGSLSKALDQNEVQLQMTEIRAPSRNTSLFFSQNYPLILDAQWNSFRELFRFRVNQAALQRSGISDLNFNRYPWWLDLRGVSLSDLENSN